MPEADSLEDLTQAVEDTLALCESRKLVTPIEKEEGLTDELGLGGYSIDETKRPLLEYYKNNILHFFLPAAMVSLSILARQGFEFNREQILEDYRFLQDFFRNEFIFSDQDPEIQVTQTLDYLSSRGVVINLDPQEASYTLSASGLKDLAYFANLLLQLPGVLLDRISLHQVSPEKAPERKGIFEAHSVYRPETPQAGGSGADRGPVGSHLPKCRENFRGKGDRPEEGPGRQRRHHLQPACGRRRQRILRPTVGQVSEEIVGKARGR